MLKGLIEKTLMLLDQRLLKVIDGVDVLSFIVSNGQVEQPSAKVAEEVNVPARKDITLRELKDQYIEAHAAEAMETSSPDTVAMHPRHFIKTLGVNFPLQSITLAKLKEHVNRRAKKKGIHNRPLIPATIRRERQAYRRRGTGQSKWAS